MALIGEKAKQEILDQVGNLLDTYLPAIDTAFTKADGAITIPFRVKLTPSKKTIGDVLVKTAVAFKLDEVKDKTEGTWVSEIQMRIGDA